MGLAFFVTQIQYPQLEMQNARWIALCRSSVNLYFKVPTFYKLFFCGFSSGVSKFLRRVVQTPQEYRRRRKKRKRKEIKGEEKEAKNAKRDRGVCIGQDWSQKNCLDKRNDICFMHFLCKHPLIAKKWSQSLKK